MSLTSTQTQTFTVADIRKVVDNFAADYSMMSQSTGLHSVDQIRRTVSDLKIFAEAGYLVEVTLILKDASGNQLRGAKYKVSESATGWVSERPGNSLWPATPSGSLRIVGTLASAWWSKTEDQKKAFQTAKGLDSLWPQTTEDTSLSSLSRSSGQKYASNGYGLERSNYAP